MRLTAFLTAAALAAGGACHAGPPRAAPTGERLFRQCYACHARESGASTPAGPTLHGIVGRRIAAEAGFDYSPALRRLAARHQRWTPELLDRFLAEPAALVPGTEMGFPGMADPASRRTLIRWLRRPSSRR